MAIPGYQIIRKIRQGGMSTVYLAVQKSVGREVALKVMSPALTSDPSFGDRFYREAKIVGQLSHPNIVSIYDVGAYKQYNYIAMDYLPREPLQDRLRHGVDLRDAVRITKDVAAALDYIHQRGYLHRDIKPDNILFRQDGSTVLCDFGIARAVKSNLKMTNMGAVLGTPHYMSPEQAQGKNIDGHTDLYSLGVVFYEMLTGQVPFPGDDPIEVAIKHLSTPPPKLPAHLKLFQPFMDRILAKKTAARFHTGREVIDALEKLEQTLGKRHQDFRANTEPSAVQLFDLLSALVSTLGAVTLLKLKHLLGQAVPDRAQRIKPLTLSDQKLLDDFVLSDDDDGTAGTGVSDKKRHQSKPKSKPNHRVWQYGSALLLAVVGGYLLLEPPQPVRQPVAEASDAVQPKAQPFAPKPAATTPPAIVIEAQPLAAPEPIPASEPTPPPVPTTPPPPTYTFTVDTEPVDATVRILNITPRYQPGMALPAGAYHVEISAADYHAERRWIKIRDQDLKLRIALEKVRKAVPAGTVITLPLADGGSSPSVVVLPQGSVTTDDQRTLTLADAVAIGTHEITYAEYDAFAVATGRALPKDFGWGRGAQPVIGIHWRDAEAYVAWLTQQTEQRYRLPTHTEWEYAARAGSSGKYWWGDDKSAKQRANCRRGCGSQWSKLFNARTAPVGSFTPNAFGLYDTAGNAAEWLLDCGAENGKNPEECTEFLVAGGSYRDHADH